MDIQQYIAADKELLLNLNGSQSLFWDGFMWVATSTIVWVPVAAMLLYICLLYTSPSPRDAHEARMPSSA